MLTASWPRVATTVVSLFVEWGRVRLKAECQVSLVVQVYGYSKLAYLEQWESRLVAVLRWGLYPSAVV
jgi:hypothetical protein